MAGKFKFRKPTLTMVLMIVFSLLCSLLLWVYVTSTEGDEITQTFSGVKVVFDGEDSIRESKGLVITTSQATSVRIQITGSRRALSKIEAADLSAVIDISSISTVGTYTSAYKITFPTGVDSGSLTVRSRTPENITFQVDKLNTKAVEVKGIFNGSAADGYSVGTLQFSPNTVEVSGPAASLDKVSYAWVEVDRDNVDKTLTFDSAFVLMDANGNEIKDTSIQTETDTVNVTLPITAIKTVDLTVNLVAGGGATKDDVQCTVEPSSITLSGDTDTLAGINNISLATIDLADVEDTMTQTYTIVIPNNTEIVDGPKEATVTVKIKGLSTKKVTVTNFSCTDITQGYTASVLVENLDVIIRGPEDVLSGISDVNVRAVADLTDFGTATGILSVPVKIYIDGTTEAGAIGEYKVYVNVSIAG